jgi:hypothetical protein
MKKTLTAFVLTLALATSGFSAVVRLAPDFSWQSAGSRRATLKNLRGQPVVLIVARSANDHSFRKQAKRLKEMYQQFASKNVVFVAALQEEGGRIPSDVPFVIAGNGVKIAADYQVGGPFSLIVIGRDGNVDMQTSKLVPATRIYDVIRNSYTSQAEQRKK